MRRRERGASLWRSAVRMALLPTALAAIVHLAVPAVAGPAQLAQGAEAAPGSVSSQLIGRMPEGFPIEVVVFDDSDTNLEIRESLVTALERTGQVVQAGAPLELLLESEIVQADFVDSAPSLGQIRAGNENQTGNRGSERGVAAEVNVWSSSKDSLLGGRQPRQSRSEHPQFHINAVLRDRETGKVIWQGDAFLEMLSSDRSRLIRSMTGPLAETFGQTVVQQAFELR